MRDATIIKLHCLRLEIFGELEEEKKLREFVPVYEVPATFQRTEVLSDGSVVAYYVIDCRNSNSQVIERYVLRYRLRNGQPVLERVFLPYVAEGRAA